MLFLSNNPNLLNTLLLMIISFTSYILTEDRLRTGNLLQSATLENQPYSTLHYSLFKIYFSALISVS